MKRVCLLGVIIFIAVAVTVISGCTSKNSPSGAVLRFISGVRVSDQAEVEKTLSFERLLIDKEGEAYLKIPARDKAQVLADFKRMIIKELTTGNLRYLGDIEATVGKEGITEDKAEVIVYDRKSKNKGYVFTLAREDGSWKIYRITAL